VHRSILPVALAIAVASPAGADDLAGRALRERQQQSDAFSLQLQQSIQSFRAGNLPPQQRLDLDSRQRDQRLRQDELFYRQGVQANSPNPGALRRAEAMRAEQDRQQQLSGFRSESVQAVDGAPAVPQITPLVEPKVSTAPIVRGRRRMPEPDPSTLGP
jgi:hypothetical protein